MASVPFQLSQPGTILSKRLPIPFILSSPPSPNQSLMSTLTNSNTPDCMVPSPQRIIWVIMIILMANHHPHHPTSPAQMRQSFSISNPFGSIPHWSSSFKMRLGLFISLMAGSSLMAKNSPPTSIRSKKPKMNYKLSKPFSTPSMSNSKPLLSLKWPNLPSLPTPF